MTQKLTCNRMRFMESQALTYSAATKHQLSKVSERSKFIDFFTFSISNSLPDLSTALFLRCSVVGRCADGFVAAGDLTNFQRSVHHWDQDVWSREQHN
ncbi:hypothetical protein EJ02DRAFT_158927 [Clathrospora elynae]|uniref:Uncharacterized protein n=1 Tax=Clathrospora elynae TaxID=706981 RepID=A0A6A5S8W9_9PLEO|nr:hypothetical protein EJ02DRAFT_158927 [Clathrospora elynae]